VLRRKLESAPLILGLPAYFYPWPGSPDWERVAQLPEGTVLVIDPADGPGSSIDPNYTNAVGLARTAGCVVLGYVDTAYAARSLAAVVDDAERHRAWYGVDGIFLDRTALTTGLLSYNKPIIEWLNGEGMRVAMNPGQPEIDPLYLQLAEYVVTFEGTYQHYLKTSFPPWLRGVAGNRLWHLVHGVPTSEELRTVVDFARDNNAGLLYVTDRSTSNPWDGLPTYWNEERALLATESADDSPGV